ncbi:TNT domain-containing protein [Sphingomonas alba]|uniref:TNT domain-containing protein n=1 Tax=Sphingomonas alba TaxID=2908208 RepID=A0ABT0RJV2_9SPHN|nr:TNT domain-containing protein [Sphingomonas alba]MCL6682909.1 TNT domain-containing protein [Sphingomonas alba]
MNNNRPFTLIAALIFTAMALVHVYRLVRPFEVVVGPCHVPQWASYIGVLVPGALAWLLFREARR